MEHLPHFKRVDESEIFSYGPFAALHPTTRRHKIQFQLKKELSHSLDETDEQRAARTSDRHTNEQRASDVWRVYRTRDNRKGRHAISISSEAVKDAEFLTPEITASLKATLLGIGRMLTRYPVWDVSWIVAYTFTWGSVVWVINSFLVWLPLQDPSTAFPGEITNAGGITAFIGATIFEIGSVFLMLEAINENRADCFGWALEEVLEERGMIRLKADDGCTHHHHNTGNLVGRGKTTLDGAPESKDHPPPPDARKWTWCPTMQELREKYLHELGFIACLSQLIGATIFWISGFTALPPIYNALTSTAAQNGAYWLPQVIGGTGFIISGTLFMVEVQEKWYLPAPKVLGWHIGVWNLIGGIGFTLCGALGFGAANSGCVYQGSLATFWGSWCFLIGSVIQWFECLDKHPVEVEEGGGRIGDTQPVA